ncbi:MAG: hypothetical protein NC902_06920 [Candidatus Omnitrophica bacterium]|nr:hypothetical protein [Candidatus Omnitrophota bacterium]
MKKGFAYIYYSRTEQNNAMMRGEKLCRMREKKFFIFLKQNFLFLPGAGVDSMMKKNKLYTTLIFNNYGRKE